MSTRQKIVAGIGIAVFFGLLAIYFQDTRLFGFAFLSLGLGDLYYRNEIVEYSIGYFPSSLHPFLRLPYKITHTFIAVGFIIGGISVIFPDFFPIYL